MLLLKDNPVYSNSMCLIRIATSEDALSVLDIYAPYIEKTSYTFETEVPGIEAFQERIDLYLKDWPWLVCNINGTVAGYAYGVKYRERAAYQWSVESSVYVHDNYQRKGIARALYTALIAILKLQGFRNLYAVINLPNDKSVTFHEKLGFEYFATYRNVGYKSGQWKDVGWWQLKLNEYSMEPFSPTPFSEMNKRDFQVILESSSNLIRI